VGSGILIKEVGNGNLGNDFFFYDSGASGPWGNRIDSFGPDNVFLEFFHEGHMNIHYEFMKFIFDKLDQQGITKTELSRRLGVNKGHVSRYDQPMTKGLGINTAFEICLAAGTTFLEFSLYLSELKVKNKVTKKVDRKKGKR
jgi:hypothetical protein